MQRGLNFSATQMIVSGGVREVESLNDKVRLWAVDL